MVIPSPLQPQPPTRGATKGNPFRREAKAAPARRLPVLEDEPDLAPAEDPTPMQDTTPGEYGEQYFDDDGKLIS